MNIYNHIDNNKRETILIMVIFIAIVSFLGWFIGEIFFYESGTFFMGIALIFSGVSAFFSYYFSDQIVLAISQAHHIQEADNPYIFKLVQNLCIATGLPMPAIYVIDDSALNAFATGRDPQHAVICVTTGLIAKLDKLEMEGVIAHELAHIQNYDIRLMSIVTILVGTTTLLADWATRGMFYGGGRRSRSGGDMNGILVIVGIIFVILSPIIATLIKLAISRNREFLADSTAALTTRYPKGLADALTKISGDREILEAANGATAHLYIANPLKGDHRNGLAGLFDTHPPVEERIKRLMEM